MNWRFWKRRSRKDLEESVSILSADLATATVKAETLEKQHDAIAEDLRGARNVVGNLIEDVRQKERSLAHCESKIEEQAHTIALEKLEAERAKAELAKAQAQLERAELHFQTQKAKMDELQKQMSATLEWIKETHHLAVPANTPIRKLLSTLTSKRNAVLAFMLLLPTLVMSQFPINTPYSQAWSQTNVISLSISNAVSKPLTNRHINGVLTLFGLQAGTNIAIFVNGSNIVINGTATGSGTVTFGDILWTNDAGKIHLTTNVLKIGFTDTNDFLLSDPVKENLSIGHLSGTKLGLGGNNNTFAGVLSGTEDTTGGFNSGFGYNTLNLNQIGSENSAFGANVLQNLTTGNENSGFGRSSLEDLTDGDDNTGFGSGSLFNVNTGSFNTGVGRQTLGFLTFGRWNAAIGWRSGFFTRTNHGTYLGSEADQVDFPGTKTNVTAVGWNTKVGQDNTVQLGNNLLEQVITTGRFHATNGLNGYADSFITGRLFISSTGLLDGLVATQDIRFLGHNSTSNFVWTCTNTATGEGEWRAATAAAGGLTTNANQFLGVPLSIKTGAFQTNLNAWGNGTNSGDFYIFTNLFMNGNLVLRDDFNPNSTLYVGETHDKTRIGLPLIVDSGAASIYPGVDGGDDLGLASQRWGGLYGYYASLQGLPNIVTLIASNWPGTTVDIAQLLSTNGLGLVINSNGNTIVNTGVFWTNSSRLLHITNSPGLDRGIVLWNTNGQGYTALSGPTNTWFPTNRFLLFVTNALPGQSLKVHSVAYNAGVAAIVLTNDFFQPASGTLSNLAGTGAQTNGMNVDQFLTNAPVISMRAGALLTNIVIQQSNNTSVSLLVTNNPGSTMNLVEMLNTNLDGVIVRSNGNLRITANEVTAANGSLILHNKGANQTYMIWTNSSGGNGSAVMRCDSAGNAVFSPINPAAQMYISEDGGSGQINFSVAGLGRPLAFVPGGAVYLFQGGTVARVLLTNIWDIQAKTNLWLSRTGLLDGVVVTNDIRFLGHNATSNNVWTCTNSTTGEGEWRTAPGATLTTNANQFGASVQLTIKDGALFTNAVFFPGSPGLTVTNIPGLGTNTFQLLNSNGQAVVYAATNNGLTFVTSNQTVLGPQTNAASKNITGGVTNWAGTEAKGTLNASSNLLVKAGQSTSNAWVGGTVWWNQDSWTNLNAVPGTLTNLSTNIIAAHVLTNNGDAVHIMWRIKLANSVANTNRFQIIYGSETVLDTGLQLCSNSVCQADLWLTRTGNTSQHADGRFEWGPGSGAPFAFTNNNVELVQTNGIATIFQLRGSSQRVGAMTNSWTRVWYDPAVR